MPDLEIVHLSDLHWSAAKSTDRAIVRDALLLDLQTKKAAKEISPDFVVFSGDLAQSGDDPEHLVEAYSAFLKPVLETLELGSDKIFIAPGNHDISRESVRAAQYVEAGLQGTLKSVESVNDFIDSINSGSSAHLPAIARMQSYYEFVDKVAPADQAPSRLLRCYNRDVGGLRIGVACFDTAWRATGEPNDVDRNRLILGERNVDLAIEALGEADIRLAVMHHPLEWMAEFDEYAVASRLSANFDMLLCGHTHRPLPQTRTTAQGTAILSQTGSVYASRRWFNGYHIISMDLAKGECCFMVRTYFDSPRRVFDDAVNIAAKGEVRFAFTPTISGGSSQLVESILREVRSTIRQSATDHMNMIGAEGADIADVKEGFVVPPLTMKSDAATENGEDRTSKFEEVRADDLLREEGNFLITAGRETGKTSLLHYLAVLAAEGNCDRPRIPVVLTCGALKAGAYNLKKAVGSYLGGLPKGVDLDEALKAGLFLFLADDLSTPSKAEVIKGHIGEFKENRWICIDQPRVGSLGARAESAEALPTFREVRIGALPRRSIRELARRWSPLIGQSDDHVFDTVMGHIKRDALPRTGYIVTLLLWAMQQETEFERINEAVLLSNVVDHLLGKADFTQATRGTFDPRSKEIVLEQLSQFFHERDDVADLDEATGFLVEIFRAKMLPFKAMDVLSELVKCGILDRTDDTVYFKYLCFQEYFLASRMRFDTQCFEASLFSGAYRKFPREFELLSGLRRENAEIISAIMSDIDENQPDDLKILSPSAFDALTEVNVAVSVSQKRLEALKKKRLSSDQIDDLMDAADRRALRKASERDAQVPTNGGDEPEENVDLFGEPSKDESLNNAGSDRMSAAEFLQSTDILARVVRNSDFTDFKIKGPATRVVLKNTVKFCLLVRKEIVALLDEALAKEADSISADERDALISFVSRLMVTASASMVSDQLSSPNIVPMTREILKDDDLSLAEKIFLTFLLQSCRAADWHDRFGELLRERADSGFLVESVLGRIQMIVNTQYLDDSEFAKVRSVIDAAQDVLGWGAGQKSKVLTDLRKAALQADLRDQRA